MKYKLAIIGYGFIGQTITNNIRKIPHCELEIVMDNVPEKIKRFKRKGTTKIRDVLKSDANLVIECAHPDAVRQYARQILESGKNLMIMSVGALANEELFRRLKKTAEEKNLKIYLPSGAIGGLDAIRAASVGGIKSLTLTTKKNPSSLGITDEGIVYEGGAEGAVEKFPLNINIAAALGIAAGDMNKPHIKIISDKGVKNNIHEIFAEGDFGQIRFKSCNAPSPRKKSTSYIAALSAIACLKKIVDPVQIG